MQNWIDELEQKMKTDWKLRWYYRWAKFELSISEWWVSKPKKWLICSWLHNRWRCYPDVGGKGLKGGWHCSKCTNCLSADIVCKGDELREKYKE